LFDVDIAHETLGASLTVELAGEIMLNSKPKLAKRTSLEEIQKKTPFISSCLGCPRKNYKE
jgi:hypothetical protein